MTDKPQHTYDAAQDFGPPENANAIQLDCWRRQEEFLAAYEKHGILALACEETGIPVRTARSWENADTQSFKKRRELAGQSALGVVEAEIHRRAIDGVDHPVIHQGVITDTYKQYSDNLLMFRAKRLDPEYRDNPKINQGNGTPSVTKIIINLAPGVEMPQSMIIEPDRLNVVDGKSNLVPEEEENNV